MSQEVADMHFEMRCASLRFHVYKSIWRPKIEENLRMKPEYANFYDPLAIAITASLHETSGAHLGGGTHPMPSKRKVSLKRSLAPKMPNKGLK